METPELSISIGELLGVPKISIRGCMSGWHDQALIGVLSGVRDNGTASIVLDMAGLTFEGAEGTASMINALRSLGSAMCVHVITSSFISGVRSVDPVVFIYR